MNPYTPEPQPQPKRKSAFRRAFFATFGVLAALIVAVIVLALAAQGGSNDTGSRVAVKTTTSAPATPAAATTQPAPAPSPNGTYQGSCDTSLAAGIYGENYLTGQIDLHNTGNIGTVLRLRFAWHQEGYPDIVLHKTTHLRAGASKTVDFRYAAGTFNGSTAVLDNFQSWQSNHSGEGCTYKAAMVNTFGEVKG